MLKNNNKNQCVEKMESTMQSKIIKGTSLAVQGLGLCASNAEGAGSIPGLETKIPHATRPKKKKKLLRSFNIYSNITAGKIKLFIVYDLAVTGE